VDVVVVGMREGQDSISACLEVAEEGGRRRMSLVTAAPSLEVVVNSCASGLVK
jgi:hypothetical protein